ncbi:hypothetical protein ABMA28_001391 [Loxostege sticticalis]|uniref:FLYWCH-type domain-containing protein n=1 Tax=Loxostege sticticalis TaxID=481309 RepID=A0ABD0T1H5_LOXSC
MCDNCLFYEEYSFIPTPRGKHLLIMRGYTYSQMKLTNNYYCSKKQSGNCKARVRLDESGNIVSANYDHTHPPPTYMQTQSGQSSKMPILISSKRRYHTY